MVAIMGWQNQQNRWLNYFNANENSADTVREQIYTMLMRRNDNRQRLSQQLKEKTREIHLLQDQQVNYPVFIELAIKTLREQCPAADPQVLCDFVEVGDARWQMAIEGYMGGARFGIIVEPAWEAESMRIVRNMSGNNKARIIQGTKAARDAERTHCPPGSIVELMAF